MSRLRVFVSSTYYDLRHLRSSLSAFIASLGHQPVLSERGNVPYAPDIAPDESCYHEVAESDVLVLIIGGRYGAEASPKSGRRKEDFWQVYNSVTKQEFLTAIEHDIPVYILVDSGVFAEYQTFRENRDRRSVKYAHVDSVNVFHLLADILALPRNNPVCSFDRYQDIEEYLREQWSGLFRELLKRRSTEGAISSVEREIAGLRETHDALKRYLEAAILKLIPDASEKIIEEEHRRISRAQTYSMLRVNTFVHNVMGFGYEFDHVRKALEDAKSIADFGAKLAVLAGNKAAEDWIVRTLRKPENSNAIRQMNEARWILGLGPLK